MLAREKTVRILYFDPWDWVIGVGCFMAKQNADNARQADMLSSEARESRDCRRSMRPWKPPCKKTFFSP